MNEDDILNKLNSLILKPKKVNTYQDLIQDIKSILLLSVNRKQLISPDVFTIKFIIDLGHIRNKKCKCNRVMKYISKSELIREICLILDNYKHREDYSKVLNKVFTKQFIKKSIKKYEI